jgi:penicillin amidase
VTIYRDSFGVPHVDAADTVSAAFGFIYAQCEDYFWQVEDSLVWGMGRYAEIYGKKSVETDVLTHSFEIPRRSRDEFNKQPEYYQQVARAMAEACNLYLATHPEVKPRLVTKFEPWHFLAFNRRVWIEIAFTSNHVSRAYMPNRRDEVYEQIGSNAWAIAPSKTKSGNAMLFINPHQPWYGYGQWYEGHIRTGDGIDFYGASFFGSPMLSIGHNHQCGWTFTVNQPDVIDVWRVRFDDSSRPNHYRHGDAYREAAVWTETIKVRGEKDRQYTFRKTHQGPILRELEDGMFEAVQVAGIYESDFLGQVLELVRSKSVHDFKKAMGRMSLPIFNGVSADRDGNILYLYNGVVPKRDARFDWAKPVDGTDPATDWQGIHTVEDLPQVLNPPTGYVQSCNSSPFTTTDDASPFKLDYPKYMVMDADVDMRRAKVSRHILRQADDITFEDLERLAFDTLMYWPMSELPRLRRAFAKLKESKPDLAARVQEYMDHFEGWDYRVAPDCTRSPLCVAWYEELYGFGYPAETLKERFQKDPDAKFEALAEAAKKIADNFGTWKVKYADIYRIQRHHNVADLIQIPLSDRKPSIPCVGAPGPLGIVFTVYYSPSVYVPIVREMRKHYAVVGTSYTGIVEFKKDGVASKSLIQFGSSSDPKSPHYDDQAKLFSQSQMKKTLFDWKEIESTCRKYHPGEKG